VLHPFRSGATERSVRNRSATRLTRSARNDEPGGTAIRPGDRSRGIAKALPRWSNRDGKRQKNSGLTALTSGSRCGKRPHGLRSGGRFHLSLRPTQCHVRGIESVHSRRRTTDPFSRIVRSNRTRRCSRLDLISMRVRSSSSRCRIRMRCTSSPTKAALAGRSRCTSQVSISDTSTRRSPIRYESPSRSSYVVRPVVGSWATRLPAGGAESRVTASVASSRGSEGGRVGAAPAGGGISGRRRIASLPVRSVVTIENGVGQSMGNWALLTASRIR
jgi:hypothetical protein